MTHIQARRNAATACMLEMMEILEWDWMQYCYFKYESGLTYLKLLTNNDEYIINQLSRSKKFWNWWKIHWTYREESFLSEYIEAKRMYHRNICRMIYEDLHSPYELLNGICKFRVDLDNDYAKMINEIHHER